MSPTQFLLCLAVLAVTSVAGNLIRGKSDIPAFPDKEPLQKLDVNVLTIPEEPPSPKTGEKTCNNIGESCITHSDCCTNACLGYLKKCVS